MINPRKTSARIIELINNPAERKMHLVREQRRLPCKRGMSVTGGERERQTRGSECSGIAHNCPLEEETEGSASALVIVLVPSGEGSQLQLSLESPSD